MRVRSFGVVVAAVAAAMLASVGVASAAPGGYGPAGGTGPSNVPGGFTSVVTTQTVGTGGGTVAAAVGGASMTVAVPSGALPAGTQIEVTQPSLVNVQSSLGTVGFTGYSAVAGIGVKAYTPSGAPVSGSFAKPVPVTIKGPGLGVAGEEVLELTGPSTVTVVPSTLGNGSVTVMLTRDPDLVVVNPPVKAAAAGGTIPGVTSQHTGLPFAGERDLAYLLAALGIVALAVAGAAGMRRPLRRRL